MFNFFNILGGSSSLDDCDWYCDDCDAYLNIQPGFSTSCGEWECTKCGCINYIDEDNIIEEDEDDVPEGCAACGGPYPDCKYSCKLFDD